MKKITYFTFAVAFIFTSCSNTKNEDQLQAQQYTIDSLNKVAVQKETDRVNAEKTTVTEKHTTTVYQPAATTTTTTTTTKKKGWSNVAKGAVIGGVVGAGTGVAVSKDKVKGGIIGGVVGAGVGAGVGAILKKKE